MENSISLPKTGGRFLLEPVGAEVIFTRETFTEEHLEIESMIKDFARDRILPNKADIEKFNQELSLKLLREMGDLGLLGIDVPEKYGGMDLDKITTAIAAESLSAGFCASFTVTFSVQTGIGALPIVWFGTEQQKEKYLPKLVTGEWVGAYGLTESTAGSDALSGKMTAVLSEDGTKYILNGEKIFISNGSWAEVFTVFAKVDGKDFSAFIVDRDTPGFEIGPEEHKMGMKGSSTTSLLFNQAEIPVDNLLYKVGKGATIAFNALNLGRFKLAASDLGGSKIVITEAIKYAQERRQFGQPISNFDTIKGKIADMIIRTYTADSMIYRTIGMIQTALDELDKSDSQYYIHLGQAMEKYAIEASMAKVFGSETFSMVTDHGIQIFGGNGFIEDYPMAGAFRDTRIDRIWEGTNEINRQIITGYMMKKALTEELPIRSAIRKIDHFLSKDYKTQFENAIEKEILAIETGKQLALYLFHESLSEFGQDLKHHQQLTEILANMFIDLYSADTTLARIRQLPENYQLKQEVTDIAIVFSSEACLRLMNIALNGLNGVFHGTLSEEVVDKLREFQKRMLPVTDILDLKARIAENVYHHGQYPY